MRKFVFSLLFLCALTCVAYAQTVVVPVGGDGEQAAFSVGQAVVGEAHGSTGSAEIGIQQSFMLKVQAIEQTAVMAGTQVSIYPNPTASMLRVEVVSNSMSAVKYLLYSEKGQLVDSRTFDISQPMDIDMTDFPTGMYILRLEQDGKIGAGYQVIKQ